MSTRVPREVTVPRERLSTAFNIAPVWALARVSTGTLVRQLVTTLNIAVALAMCKDIGAFNSTSVCL